MIRRAVLASALGAALACGGPAGADTLRHYTSAWFFGDSLTDPGNLFEATGGELPPDPPYFQGRSSNGRVWAEHLADDFEAKGLPTANFGFAYATAGRSDDVALGRPLQIPDLPDQIGAFGASSAPDRLGRRPVATLWFGANDLFNAIAATPTAAGVTAAATGAAAAVADGIGRLSGFGVRDFVVMNLPPLERIPAFTMGNPDAAPLAALGSGVFNATLAEHIAALPGKTRVSSIDMNGVFSDLIANPEKYGVTDATNPCFIAGVSLCTPGEADERAFFDLVHPNRVIHGEIADIVRAEVAPVPLPAPALLLIAAVGGLGAMARRRRALPA